ncbi:GIY-YIG nuclease family protein [Cryobacterium frigoriphilum]|uniref:GIY-YIG nuclease family protein n=1 Tax=Cryobacterium frigoriphilum TaxID=1259150 RepID=A0A4V3IQF4_9MICO|nr:GIY-YIG nuclease family protein [Cryobacterium frigoriphilum]TFD45388.1 GIY-YIG nuclease family protein [Cryobacterium frigoriphilum]
MPYMYILECADGSFYVGSTWDIDRRLWQHNSGEGGAAYTKRRRPVKLVYLEECPRIADAYAREKQIQGWNRAKRIALIEGRFDDLPALSIRRSRIPPPADPSSPNPLAG